jgi:pseudaminic acid biosynthesis-associated methylase
MEWMGEFGKEYTDRNVVDWKTRLPGLREIFNELTPNRVPEVGCNRGHNLVALRAIWPDSQFAAVEPNPYAVSLAREANPQAAIFQADAFDLPLKDGWADLAIACGVLIHIALPDLKGALAEIHRVSRRWVMTSDYYAAEETEVKYRGHNDLLWKRDLAGTGWSGFLI